MRIEAKIAGQRRELFAPYELEWPHAKELTLRQLLGAVVREEVAAHRQRQRARQLDRVLTSAQIAVGAEAGKVDPAGRPNSAEVEEDAAVATAVEAFEDGLFFVFVDGRQVDGVDALVHVVPASSLLFVRLTPLAGAELLGGGTASGSAVPALRRRRSPDRRSGVGGGHAGRDREQPER